jgi:hypothetical protein
MKLGVKTRITLTLLRRLAVFVRRGTIHVQQRHMVVFVSAHRGKDHVPDSERSGRVLNNRHIIIRQYTYG